jgi:hypothetical protein
LKNVFHGLFFESEEFEDKAFKYLLTCRNLFIKIQTENNIDLNLYIANYYLSELKDCWNQLLFKRKKLFLKALNEIKDCEYMFVTKILENIVNSIINNTSYNFITDLQKSETIKWKLHDILFKKEELKNNIIKEAGLVINILENVDSYDNKDDLIYNLDWYYFNNFEKLIMSAKIYPLSEILNWVIDIIPSNSPKYVTSILIDLIVNMYNSNYYFTSRSIFKTEK